jgi:hypothetical protein
MKVTHFLESEEQGEMTDNRQKKSGSAVTNAVCRYQHHALNLLRISKLSGSLYKEVASNLPASPPVTPL